MKSINPEVLVASLALFISIASAVTSYRATHHQLASTTFHRVIDNFARIDEKLLEHPDLWPYIYDGVEVPTDVAPAISYRLGAMCELILDVFEWVANDIPNARPVDKEPWTDFITTMVRNSPALSTRHSEWRTLRPLLDRLVNPAL
jgi:hypothetical protein